MFRRRRPQRDGIVFGFDSFLDLVANVIGVIIRLILVAWVGARSYTTAMQWLDTDPLPAPLPPPQLADDPLHAQLAQRRQELEKAQAQLLEHLRQIQHLQQQQRQPQQELATLTSQRHQLAKQRQDLERALASRGQTINEVHLSLDQLQQRSQQLLAQIEALNKSPSAKKVLRFRTPVSRPVHVDEVLFECKAGRVTYIDLPAFLTEVKQGLEAKADLLRHQWQVAACTVPVGAFRLSYTLEREKDLFSSLVTGGEPMGSENFRYGLTRWVVEPIVSLRGESCAAALASNSAFRGIVDNIDPQQTVVTFNVYPDSFSLYRQLRDYLYQRDVEVAGRPLPEGIPIAASRHGSTSRGQ